jgi:predicted dehydrogenase
MDKDTPLLVAGAGSIGERHIGILQKLGFRNIHVFRQRNRPLRNIDSDTVNIITHFDEVKAIRPVAAFICTPTSQHLAQAVDYASIGIHLLVEKPLACEVSGFELLKKKVLDNKVCLQVAYMLRFHPLMQKLKGIILNNRYGNLLNFQTYWGEYLPDWHPWEDYRKSYAARKELGGGAALTLSHDIDLAIWLTNSAISGYCTTKNYRSQLDVDVESGVDINFQFANGVTGHCHLNFFEKALKRSYRFVFENASIEIDYLKNEMTIFNPEEDVIRLQVDHFERNQMFEEQCKSFLSKIENFQLSESIRQIEESEKIIGICNQ